MSINNAQFPLSVWDGSTPDRPNRTIDAAPSGEDWDQVVAEVIATQTLVVGLGTIGLAAIPALTDSTTGTPNGTLGALPGDSAANNATAANKNFAELNASVNLIIARLVSAGIVVAE